MSQKLAEVESKYSIKQNEQVGRYMVAAQDLEAGEEILSELPFIVGPKACTYPVCLGCYAPWPPSEDDDAKPLCSRCGWSVCSVECEAQPLHADFECQVFSESKHRLDVEAALADDHLNGVPHYECITPLRLLLAREQQPERWAREIKDMEAHNEKRSEQKTQWDIDHVNIVQFICKRLGLADRFSEEEVHTACGILDINCHEVRTSKGFPARALYPQFSRINHSCVANTTHSVAPVDFRVTLRTAVRVAAQAELHGSYVHAMLPTLLRRQHLLENKHFECSCLRCADPTELGTHMSSLKCNKCDNGIVLTTDALVPDSQWKCTHCEFTTNGQAVARVFQIIQGEMDQVEAYTAAYGPEAIQVRETFMKKYKSVLHPRHALLTIPRYSLSQLYGRVEEYLLDDLPDIILEHKIEMCRQVLEVLDVVMPGKTRSRGMILYELHAPLLFLAKNQWATGVIDAAALRTKMTESAGILEDSIDILRHEPEGTPEADIATGAKLALVQLRQSISEV